MPIRILVDANFLIAWKGRAGNLAARASAERFVSRLTGARSCIVIPTPALAEYLVKADAFDVEAIQGLVVEPWALLGSFDYTAALELRALDQAARGLGDKKAGSEAPWQKIKVDRQIVAIGCALRCDLIITSDQSVMASALRVGIPTCAIEHLDTLAIASPRRRSVREAQAAWQPSLTARTTRAADGPY